MTGRKDRVALRALRLAALYLAMVSAFVIAMTAVYALPQGRIMAHVRESLPLLKAEGRYPRPVLDKRQRAYMLDNYTDALMLDAAIVSTDRGPLYAAMGCFKGASTADDPIAALVQTAAGRRQNASPYAYYWHGYQLLLRPSLLLMTYGDIRYLNILLLSALAFWVATALRDRGGRLLAGTFLFSLVLAGFYLAPLSMQFSGIVYLTLLGTLAVLALDRRDALRQWGVELFLVVGMLTSFVDLLTAPLLTLGMPLAVALVLLGREERASRAWRSLLLAAGLSLSWAFGYAASWVTKWFAASAVLHSNIVRMAGSELLFRVGARDERSRVAEALMANFLKLFPMVRGETLLKSGVVHDWLASPYVLLLPLAIAVALWLLAFNRKPSEEIARALPVLWVAPLPYLWIAAASNHSAHHAWFTYRIQAVTVFAVSYALLASVDFERVRSRLRLRPRGPGAAADERSEPAEEGAASGRLG